jgi:predicted DNA-binding protein (MmcQ/YjbR family)
VEGGLSEATSSVPGMVRGRPEPDPAWVARVGEVALRLPGAHEDDAWTGVRWRIRQRTFAHVVALHHADAVSRLGITDGRPVTVVTLRSAGEERAALAAIGPPYLTSWSDDVVAVVLDDDTDLGELEELVIESYRLMAPRRLVRELDGP